MVDSVISSAPFDMETKTQSEEVDGLHRLCMTWNELKKLVDEEIAKKKSDGNVCVWLIDISYPYDIVHVEVDDGALKIRY